MIKTITKILVAIVILIALTWMSEPIGNYDLSCDIVESEKSHNKNTDNKNSSFTALADEEVVEGITGIPTNVVIVFKEQHVPLPCPVPYQPCFTIWLPPDVC